MFLPLQLFLLFQTQTRYVVSVLVGPAALIKKAIHFRKLFGGGIRQSGAIAAAADFALTHNFDRLNESHVLAKRLSAGLKELGVQILYEAETSMVCPHV